MADSPALTDVRDLLRRVERYHDALNALWVAQNPEDGAELVPEAEVLTEQDAWERLSESGQAEEDVQRLRDERYMATNSLTVTQAGRQVAHLATQRNRAKGTLKRVLGKVDEMTMAIDHELATWEKFDG